MLGGMTMWESGRESALLDDIIAGRKTIEGRLNKGKFADYAVGDVVQLRRDIRGADGILRDGIPNAAQVQIIAIRLYTDFLTMVQAEDYKKVIPLAESAEEAAAEYNKYYSAEDQAHHGVLAIEVQLFYDWDRVYANGRDFSHILDSVVADIVAHAPIPRDSTRRALDVGCGVGNLVRQLAAQGCQTIGVDPAPEAIKRAVASEDGNMYFIGDISVAPRGEYDIITCKHVYRFIPNKFDFLERVHQLLVSGGVFAVITPTLDRIVKGKPGIAVDRAELYEQLDVLFERIEERELPTGLLVVCKKVACY